MLIMDSNQYSMEMQARENGKQSLLDYMVNEPIEVENLETGDIAFVTHDDKLVGIEIKLYPNDFYASVRDNRLIKQMIRLVNDYDYKYLLCVGELIEIDFNTGRVKVKSPPMGYNLKKVTKADIARHSYNYHYINSHFLARFESAGGNVRWVQDKKYAAATILSLNRFYTKPRESIEFVKPKLDLTQVGWQHIDNKFALTLSTFGLSPKDSISIANQVKSLDKLFELSPQEIGKLYKFNHKHIGDNTGMKLYMALRGQYDL